MMFAAVMFSAVMLAALVFAAVASGMPPAMSAPVAAAAGLHRRRSDCGAHERRRQHVTWNSFQHDNPLCRRSGALKKSSGIPKGPTARRMSQQKSVMTRPPDQLIDGVYKTLAQKCPSRGLLRSPSVPAVPITPARRAPFHG